MVHMETQTDLTDEIDAFEASCKNELRKAISTESLEKMSPEVANQIDSERQIETNYSCNGNLSADMSDANHMTQNLFDYMNSNEQLDLRESSDEENVEQLNRRISQFFSQNQLFAHTDNGNDFDILNARRSCVQQQR